MVDELSVMLGLESVKDRGMEGEVGRKIRRNENVHSLSGANGSGYSVWIDSFRCWRALVVAGKGRGGSCEERNEGNDWTHLEIKLWVLVKECL